MSPHITDVSTKKGGKFSESCSLIKLLYDLSGDVLGE